MSLDNGVTWTAVPCNGENIIFKSVEEDDNGFVRFTLSDGASFDFRYQNNEISAIALIPRYLCATPGKLQKALNF